MQKIMTFFAYATEDKKAMILKLSPIDFALNFVQYNFYRS